MNQTSISTYHEYILEGICALRQGLEIVAKAEDPSNELPNAEPIFGEFFCRYSFLMIANSLEAAANALVFSVHKDSTFYLEAERLNTLFKYQLFCQSFGSMIPDGNHRYSRIKELISCRNEFVHPKPRRVNYYVDPKEDHIDYAIKKTKSRGYPHYFAELKPFHVLNALEDSLTFVSWICFDLCKLSVIDGALRLGVNSYGSTADINLIEVQYNKKFDKRSFGIEEGNGP